MMDKPKVSVVVPVYNAKKYIVDNIKSLIAQSYDNYELIYVDDGSTDDSAEIIKTYAKENNNIIYVRQKNRGAGIARNTGMKYATGEYIIFLDADDFFHVDLLKSSVFMARKFDLDICIVGANIIDQNIGKTYECFNAVYEGGEKETVFCMDENPDEAFLISGSFPWNKLYSFKFIKDNNLLFQDLRSINDLYFVFVSYVLAKRIAVCPKCLVYYRSGNNGGLTVNNDKEPENIFRAYCAVKKYLCKIGKYKKYEKGLIKIFFWDLFTALHRMRSWDKFKYLYDRIKNVYAMEFSLFERTIEYFKDEYLFSECGRIRSCSSEEYLFKKTFDFWERERREMVISLDSKFLLKTFLFAPNINMIIYGLGNVGRDVVDQIVSENKMNISVIVDNFSELHEYKGVKIVKKCVLCDYKYDYILITVMNQIIFNEIHRDLLLMGIDETKILNIKDYIFLN